jgi:hypothetical protein
MKSLPKCQVQIIQTPRRMSHHHPSKENSRQNKRNYSQGISLKDKNEKPVIFLYFF